LNRLYYGDNLQWLPEISPESVDLVYLDPPFNSKRAYNAIFRGPDGKESAAQVQAFSDYWEWTPAVERTYHQLINPGPRGHRVPEKLITFLEAIRRLLGDNNMAAYLIMMAARMTEMWRVLKPTGSLYLHCDPTASHYLKVILDSTFGPENFIGEIVWKRYGAHGNAANAYGAVHDVILFYGKTRNITFNKQFVPYAKEYAESRFRLMDDSGRRYQEQNLSNPAPRPNLKYAYTASNGVTYQPHSNGWKCELERMKQLDAEGRLHFPKDPRGRLRLKMFLDECEGVPVQDLWTDIFLPSSSKERIGYPTQKPLALLERIIRSSSNEGDVVLDPFCGCGTAIEAAEKLKRTWIGVDITYLAVPIIRRRLKAYPDVSYKVLGLPADLESAMALASDEDKYQYQWWAVDQIGAMPVGTVIPFGREGKKGGDKGIDGVIRFKEHPQDERSQRIIVSVKASKVLNPAMIRELRGTIEREKAPIGVFLSAYEPTAQMRSEAAAAGTYRPEGSKRAYQRIQLISAADIFKGKTVDFPGQNVTEEEAAATAQLSLFDESAKRKEPKRSAGSPVPEEIEDVEDSMSN